MVYREAARKTGAFMALAAIAGFVMATFLEGSINTPTGLVIGGNGTLLSGTGWVVFAVGFFAGALVLGTYTYVAHLDKKDPFEK